jgi:GNAT superfamily N-acetyltransferase
MGIESVEITRAAPDRLEFRKLVEALDAELAARDGSDHGFYHQFNGLEGLDRVVLATLDGEAVACGGMKAFGDDALEVKRMYTRGACRGQGLGGKVLEALEKWAREDGFLRIVLETGKRQPEAIGLYLKHGYRPRENYGPYAGIANSVCFEKKLL